MTFASRSPLSGRFLVALLALGALGACSSNPVSPWHPEVLSNPADNFLLQAANVTNVTTTVTNSWVNTGTRATITHSTTTTAGSTLLVIKDAAGATVYSKALSPSLEEPSLIGKAGTWSIQLTLTSYSGSLNFRVQAL